MIKRNTFFVPLIITYSEDHDPISLAQDKAQSLAEGKPQSEHNNWNLETVDIPFI